MRRPVIVTQNPATGREFTVNDSYGRQWFTHYGRTGSGFGYLTWRMPRRVGYDYKDIGFGYRVTMRKGFRVLFDGQIVRVFERSRSDGDEIEVWALGWVWLAGNDVHNRIYCDTRTNEWLGSETPDGSFRPDRFDLDTNDRLSFSPRRYVDYLANDYTRLRYTFPFGEAATRFVASYEIALPSSWPGKLELRDSDGNVLWSQSATGTGSLDVTTTGTPTYFETRFYVTTAGESTAEPDTVYGRLTGVKVYSVNVQTLDMAVIARQVLDTLVAHGISRDNTQIRSTGLALEPSAFDRDMTVDDVLCWCAQFGDAHGRPVAWGVRLDDTRRLFVEPIGVQTVRYVVAPGCASLERGGDWGESAQVAYGIYANDSGRTLRTADLSDQAAIARLHGYRRQAINVTGSTDGDRVSGLVQMWLDENSEPLTSGSFILQGGAHTPRGVYVPYDEITPGGLVQVREWRAVEVSLSAADFRDRTTTFPLAGVRVDEDAQTAELIPNTTSSAFEQQLAIIQNIA